MSRGAAREKVEAAMMAVVVEQGAGEASIKEIAQRAGVSQGALYRHWKSKEEMVVDVFARHYLGLSRDLDEALLDISTTSGRIKACVSVFCRLFDDNPVLFGFLLMAQHNGLRTLPQSSRTPVDVIEDVVAAGQRAGDIPAGDTAARAAAAFGVVIQTAVTRVYGRIEGPLANHVDRLSAAALAAAQA